MAGTHDAFYRKSLICLHLAVICSLPLHPVSPRHHHHPPFFLTYLNHISLSRLRMDKGQTFSSPLPPSLCFSLPPSESQKLCLYD